MSDPAKNLALLALGDQVQQVCQQTDLTVIGFVILVLNPDGTGSTAELRTRADREAFLAAINEVSS